MEKKVCIEKEKFLKFVAFQVKLENIIPNE